MNAKEASRTSQGTRFENHVARLLSMLGFTVERDVLIHGRQIDIVAVDERGPIASRYLVECKDQAHKVTTREFESFMGRVQSLRNDGDPRAGGIFVTTTGYVKEAKRQAKSLGIDLIHIGELERSLADLTPLVSAQLNELCEEQGVTEFVEPKLRLDGRTEARPAMPAIKEWLYNRHKNQLTLLGDFGVGKTTLLRRLTVDLAEKFLKTRSTSQGTPAPIYVDLRQDLDAISLSETVVGLFKRYGSNPYSYEMFWQLFREGRILILLDGFDEMASRIDAELTIQNFREINRSAFGRSKLILSCRTHYFIDDTQVHSFHGDHERTFDPVFTELYQEIAGRPNFEIRHLEDFDPDQITTFIRNRLGNDAEKDVWEVLDDHYNLADLARRPVLLDMILDSLDRIREESGEVTSALLYEVYTNIWLKRNDWKTSIDPETRALLIEEAAAQMTVDGRNRLHHKELPSLIRQARPDLDRVGIEECDRELRRAGFLVRDSSGAYRFAHRSFQEFFFAKYLVRRILVEREFDVLGRGEWRSRVTGEVFRFVCDMVRRNEAASAAGARLLDSRKLGDEALWLLIKFVSRSDNRRVVDALSRLVDDLKEASEINREEPWELHLARPLAIGVTALGWLRRDDDPILFLELLGDEGQPLMVRHNALIALSRSEHPDAISGVREFIATCTPRAGVVLFSSRITLGMIAAGWGSAPADAVLDRWTKDKAFAVRWQRSANLAALCTLCEHSEHPAAQDILQQIAVTSDIPRAVAFAVLALDESRLTDVEEVVLAKVQGLGGGRWWLRQAELVEALSRFKFAAATDRLAEMTAGGTEEVAEVALVTLCDRAPDRAYAVIYDGPNPWLGKHWSSRLRLAAGELLGELYPDVVSRDVRRLLGGDRLSGPEALRALRLLARIAPAEFREIVVGLFAENHPAAVVAFACELLYELDEVAGREVALGFGLAAVKSARRLRIVELLRSDNDDAVTAALFELIPTEEKPEVRVGLARALITPGRNVPSTALRKLIADEEDDAVLEILEFGLHPDTTGEEVATTLQHPQVS